MSTISAVGSASSAWSDLSSARASAMKDKMFAKVDTDGSGSVDTGELQGLLDHIAAKTGQTAGSASDLMSKMDTNGNGTLSESELDNGMKSLMPAPSSTVDFAQQRTEGGQGSEGASGAHHHHHGGPPPADTSTPGTTDSSSGSTSCTAALDPLDTNGDGVVSPEERIAGDLQTLMSDLQSTAAANGDNSSSSSQLSTFKTNFDSALDSAISSMQASSSSSSSSSSSDTSSNSGSSSSTNQQDGVTLSSLVEMMLKQYRQAAATSSQASTLSVAA